MIKPIVIHPHLSLRSVAEEVVDFDATLKGLIDDLVDTMHHHNGLGLAAPQISSLHRVIVVQLPNDKESRKLYGKQAGVLYVVVNPEIIQPSKKKTIRTEGCLSIPGIAGTIERHSTVTVVGKNGKNKPVFINASGLLAAVFQHEVDHLNGRLFIDIAKAIIHESHPENYTVEANL